jgi:sugar phosphate permease
MAEEINKALRYRWLIFLIFSIGYLLLFFHRICPAVLAPELVATFNISGVELGILSSAYFYSYSLMQVPIGILSDSWGPRKTATIFGFVAALGVILFALSNSLGFATFSRVLVGLGVSAVFVPAMKIFTEWFKGIEYARIAGLFVAAGALGWLVGTTPLAMLVQRFHWRTVFIVIGILTLLLAALMWLVVADRPEKKGFPPIVDRSPSPAVRRRAVHDIKRIVLEKRFWPFAMWFFFRTSILFGFFGLWAGPYLMDVYKLSKLTVGNILFVVPLGMIVGSPLHGYTSDRLASRKKVLVGSSILHCSCWAVMLIFHDSMALPALYVMFLIMGILAGSPGNVGFSSIKEIFPISMAGTSIGAANLFAFFGGVLLQPAIGYVLDKIGKIEGAYPPSAYRVALFTFFIISLLALGSILFSKETMGQDGTG